MDVTEFQHALKLGLGRAILHLQKHDSTPYRDIILQACLKDTVYDRQIEGNKDYYLMQLVHLTGEKSFYQYHILNATSWINSETNADDADHLLDMTHHLATRGNKKARQIFYDVFSRYVSPTDFWRTRWIIRLDKFKGLLFVANRLNDIVLNVSQSYDLDSLLRLTEELIGKIAYEKKLQQARKRDSQFDSFLKKVDAFRQQRKPNKRPDIAKFAYEELKAQLDDIIGSLWPWGTRADEQSLKQAARDLLEENDPKRIKKYLSIFHDTPFPLEPQLLFPLIDHPDRQNRPIPVETLMTLANVQHPSVYDLALKLINENHFAGAAVRLLKLNFKAGDWQRIEEVTKRSLDDMDYHELQLTVRDIFKAYPMKEAIQSLLNMYEYGPCSFCRRYTLDSLHSIDAIPDSVRQECLYDSNLDIRALAKRNFEPEAQ